MADPDLLADWAQEVLLAFWLEQKYTKDQILAMYLNRVFFGSNAYGVEAAARRYFNKSARDVNLGEAALLAGLLKAPSRLSPARDPEAAEARAQVVLQAMLEEGYITQDEIKTAMTQPPTKAKRYWSGAGQYVADLVRDEVTMLIGKVTEDIVVETTIDMTLEKKAEAALTESLAAEGDKVKVTLRFRGRELAHGELGMKLLVRVQEDTAEDAKVEQYPRMEGRQMLMVLSPK